MSQMQATQVRPEASVKEKLFCGGWLVVSVALILAACAALAIGVYLMAWALWGLGAVNEALDGVASYDTKLLHTAPADVQSVFFVVLIIIFVCLAIPVLLAALIRGRNDWRSAIALKPADRMPSALWLFVFVFAMPVYLFVASYAIRFFYPDFRTWFFVPGDLRGMILSFVAVVIMAPIAEELFFRGWIFTSLRKSFRASTAVIVTALLFAMAHTDGGLIYPLAVFIPGLAMTFIRQWTGTIRASIGAHALYNAWAWVLVLVLGRDLV